MVGDRWGVRGGEGLAMLYGGECNRWSSCCVRVSMTMACCWAGGCVVASRAAGLVAASRPPDDPSSPPDTARDPPGGEP